MTKYFYLFPTNVFFCRAKMYEKGNFQTENKDQGNLCSCLGTQYSDWIPVPANRDTVVSEIVEGKKFQTRTDKKIDGTNDIRWIIQGGSWLTFSTGSISSSKCNGGYVFTETDRANMGFFLRAGVFTFLKTSTQLQVWFDDVLEFTWVYEDNDANSTCAMRGTMTGLQFRGVKTGVIDDVSTHYRNEVPATGMDLIARTTKS